MNVKAIAFLSLLAVSTLGAPAFSQTQEIDVSKIPTMKIEDWRSPSSCSPPWSTPALAYALRTAPLEVATIRAEFADSGLPYSSDIGIGTVTAWRTVYQQAKDPGQVSNNKPKVTPSIATSGDKPKVKVKR